MYGYSEVSRGRSTSLRAALIAASAGVGVLMFAAPPASADPAAKTGAGWYVRGEIGGQFLAQDRGYWHGPGPGPGAPRITFSLDGTGGVIGGAGAGYDWANGVRTDLAFTLDSHMDVTGNILSVSTGGPTAPHTQSITAGVDAQSFTANVFLSPLEMMGNESTIQPFVTAGVGTAHVAMGDWTRYNPSDARVYRTFYGADEWNLAWSVGAGVSFRLGDVADGHPVLLDLTYRYSNLGNISGSATPLPANGNGDPQEPFNFDLSSHTVTVGLRVPLGG